MQVVRREQPPVAVKLEHRGTIRPLRGIHLGLVRQLAALEQIARRARRGDVLPARHAAPRSRHEMIEGQVLIVAAVLASEFVAQEHVELGEGGIERGPDVSLERDHARQLHLEGRGADGAIVFGNDIDAVEEDGLHRVLPAPQRERIVGQRPEIGVQHQCGEHTGGGRCGGDVQGGKSLPLPVAPGTLLAGPDTIGACQECEGA